MNKQKLNIFLITFLVIIWGFVGYRFFSNSSKEINSSISIESKIANTNPLKKKSFILSEISRDPFLGTYSHPKKKIVNPRKNYNTGKKTTSKPWPKIEYFGFVKGETNKHPLALLKVNNKLQRIREGANYEALHVKKIFKDSIEILNGKEKRIFKTSN